VRVAALVCFAVVLAATAPLGAAATAPVDTEATTPEATSVSTSTAVAAPENDSTSLVEQTVTYRRTPGNESSVEITVAFEVHESVEELCVNVQ
jgi:hypothetical protein